MDPKTLAAIEAMKEELAAGGDDTIVTGPNGVQMRVRKNPEPGVSLSVSGIGPNDATLAKTWEPSAHRPAGYPDDLPHLAGRVVMVTWMPNGMQLQWPGPMGDAMELLSNALNTDGWRETTLPTPTMPGMTIRPFRRGDRQRVVVGGGEILALVDTPVS